MAFKRGDKWIEEAYDLGTFTTPQQISDAAKVMTVSPYWVMVVVPYKLKNTYTPSKIINIDNVEKSDVSGTKLMTDIETVEESDEIFDLTDNCVNWRINHSKSSHIMNGSFTLVRPDVIGPDGKRIDQQSSYNETMVFQDIDQGRALNSIKTQDWVMFWAMDNKRDFDKVRDLIRNPDKIGKQTFLNDRELGLKFVGKIKSFRSTMSVAANGVVMKKYFVEAQGFSEFDSTIYYNQFAEIKEALSFKLGNLLNDFIVSGNSVNHTTAQRAIPFFSNLLLDMSLRNALAQGTVQPTSELSSFIAALAPNGPLIVPKGVYDLLVAKPKVVSGAVVQQTTAQAQPATSGALVFYWPLASKATVTSPFGPRTAPIAGASTDHKGIDIDVNSGVPVLASAAGNVSRIIRNSSGLGNAIYIDHGAGSETRYAHLSSFSVSNGQSVQAGQQIGLSGNTGLSTGAHLHFEIRKNGTPVNPQSEANVASQTPYSAGATQATTPTPTPAPVAPPTPAADVTTPIYSYGDILYQYIGISVRNTSPRDLDYIDDPKQILQSDGLTPLLYSNTYQMGDPISTTLLAQTIHFDSRSIWSILKTYLNEPINEMFTAMRTNHEGRIFPTLVCRQLPFSSKGFAESDQWVNSITQYQMLPEWFIPNEQIVSYDVGYSDALDVNYVKLDLMLELVNGSAARINQMVNVPPVFDSADIMRNGLRMLSTVCSATAATTEEAYDSARFWTKLVADVMFRLKYQVNGNVTCRGIQKDIAIGDNVTVNGVTFHIEGITHDGNIDMAGRKRFNTSLSLSHGEPVNVGTGQYLKL